MRLIHDDHLMHVGLQRGIGHYRTDVRASAKARPCRIGVRARARPGGGGSYCRG